MPLQKNQLRRLIHIATQLRENRYPNATTLLEDFREISRKERLDMDCSRKTIQRDMNDLRKLYGCPLAFDHRRRGYYLKHQEWSFLVSSVLGDRELLALMLGVRVAECIFPQNLRCQLQNAAQYLLQHRQENSPLDRNICNLQIESGTDVGVDVQVFMALFEGWRQHKCVDVTFRKDGRVVLFEPLSMGYYHNHWYVKGFCHDSHQPLVLCMAQLANAKLTSQSFKIAKGEKAPVISNDDVLSCGGETFQVRMALTEQLRQAIAERPLHSQQYLQEDGSVVLPAISREMLFMYLLRHRGEATLLEPDYLRQEYREVLAEMLRKA